MKHELSDKEMETYSRQIVLKDIGYEGQLKIRNGSVCIVGLGGLGCPLATQLTAIGVGHLRIVDRDVIEHSNLHRQHLYDVSSLGHPKVEVAARKLNELNPDVEIEPVPLSLNVDNAELIIKDVDVVADGLDRIEPRYAVNRACIKLGIPYVFGAAIESSGNASTIVPKETPCLECFYPNLRDELLPTCGMVGVHPSLLGIVSSLEASEVVRILMGEKPRLANKLLYCDLRNLQFDEINISRREDCPICGINAREPPSSLKRKLIQEICGRGGKRTFVVTPRENLNISIEDLTKYLSEKHFPIKVKANLGVTFNYMKTTASILKSGVMVVEGAEDQEQTSRIYREIVENLGIPWSRVE